MTPSKGRVDLDLHKNIHEMSEQNERNYITSETSYVLSLNPSPDVSWTRGEGGTTRCDRISVSPVKTTGLKPLIQN